MRACTDGSRAICTETDCMLRGEFSTAITARICCLAVCLGSLAALLPASQASAYDPGTSPDFFGPDKAATLDGLATSMGQQGISWTRLTFDQANDEKQPGSFNWYAEDTM